MTDGDRTRDHRNHNPALYQLSYSHHCIKIGAPTRTRTWNLLLRRQLLYPVELWAPDSVYPLGKTFKSGRGREIARALRSPCGPPYSGVQNRKRFCRTPRSHLLPDLRMPLRAIRKYGRGREIRTPDILLPKQARYQTALYPDSARKSERA